MQSNVNLSDQYCAYNILQSSLCDQKIENTSGTIGCTKIEKCEEKRETETVINVDHSSYQEFSLSNIFFEENQCSTNSLKRMENMKDSNEGEDNYIEEPSESQYHEVQSDCDVEPTPSKIKKKKSHVPKKDKMNNLNSMKKPIRAPCTNCRLKCSTRISQKERLAAHAAFWNLTDKSQQWDFIDRMVVTTGTSTGTGARRLHNKFHLETSKGKIKVCSTMFYQTLSITKAYMDTIRKKRRGEKPDFIDQRGRHSNRTNKISDQTVNLIREHINYYLLDEISQNSACKRRDCLLDSNLNVVEMYESYKSWMLKKDASVQDTVKISYYRMIFNREFNLRVQRALPTDACGECGSYASDCQHRQQIEEFPLSVILSEENGTWPKHSEKTRLVEIEAAQELTSSIDTATKPMNVQKKDNIEATSSKTATSRTKNKKVGNDTQKKPMGPACYQCRLKCTSRVSLKDRRKIHADFWNIAEKVKKWDYINKMIITERTSTGNGIRNIRTKYYFPTSTGLTKVCSTMFLHTLNISKSYVETIQKKVLNFKEGEPIFTDERGKHHNRKKISEHCNQQVRDHINFFPRVKSGLKKKSKEYLDSNLNVVKMYELYKTWMEQKGKSEDIVTMHRYKAIFHGDFNLYFLRPCMNKVKESCDECAAYENAILSEKETLLETHNLHLQKVLRAKELINIDTEESKSNSSICTVLYDMQALQLPKIEYPEMDYKRRLGIFNFTIHELAVQGECNVWIETDGKRGINEIGSCLYHFITRKAAMGVTEFRFHSETYGGQYRNCVLFSMYTRAARDLNVTIIQKYLVKGHTQTEKNSMIPAIDREAENRSIFSLDELYNLMATANKEGPSYRVNKISSDDFLNLEEISDRKFWKKIGISRISQLKVTPNAIEYQYEDQDNVGVLQYEIESININQKDFVKYYKEKLKIDADKKKDLQYFIENDLIPKEHCEFYLNLIK